MGLEEKKIVVGGDCFVFVVQKAQARNIVGNIRKHNSVLANYTCLI